MDDETIETVQDVIDSYIVRNQELMEEVIQLRRKLEIKDKQIQGLLMNVMYLNEEDHNGC